MRISVICTVLNEAAAVGRLLDGLLAQTRPPDEVIIVDGGSSDGTPAVILSYADRLPLKLQEARGANISRGRNLAVKRSSGDVIASTDAGVRLARFEPVRAHLHEAFVHLVETAEGEPA